MPKIDLLRRDEYFHDAKAQVVVFPQPAQADMVLHRHEFAELVNVLSGWAVHVTDDARHVVQAGDVLFINSSRSHAYEETHKFGLANILVREDVFREAEREFGALAGYHALFTLEPMRWRKGEFTSRLRLNKADLRQVGAWLEMLEQETKRPRDGGRLLARCWLMLIVGLMARRYGQDAAESPHLELRLGRVLSWIEQNFHRPIRIGDLAQRAAMSERTFLRRFREATQVSPVEYLIRTRIRRAKELLEQRVPGRSITEIAFLCGFEDSNYFARQFRRATGRSPRTYARQDTAPARRATGPESSAAFRR